jgi:Mg/Co/Ni transporter MgtE
MASGVGLFNAFVGFLVPGLTQAGLIAAIALPVRLGLLLSAPCAGILQRVQASCGPWLGMLNQGSASSNSGAACLFLAIHTILPLYSALQVVACWRNVLAGLFPLLSVRLGLDPAATAMPLMAVIGNPSGCFLFLSLARVLLHVVPAFW